MEEKRVVDYFVVAGLPDNPLPLEEFSNEAAIKPTFKQDPITDIVVINKSLGEKVPKGFDCIERTPTGFPADLNHGSIRCHEMYLCYRRSRDKSPLTDIGVLYEGKEKLIPGCEVVHTTAFGHPANVNNASSGRIYVTYRRASEAASSDTLAVVDICVILANKNEDPPLAYNRISKNLNKGMMGSDVFLCYKKAMNKTDVLAYKPAILARYPAEDYAHFPLPESVAMFCLPMGATIECWSAKAQHPLPVFSTFILTGSPLENVYGAAVTFYEEYPEGMLSDLQMRHLGLKNKHIREQYRILKTVHANKCICLLSHWPFFDAFKKFLSYLYKISITGPHTVPIERHISHFMYDVPYPSPQRPRILVMLNHEALSLCMPEDSPLPQSGASFITLLKNVGPENCMSMLLYILLEHKILIHSLRPAVLTGVAEAVTSMIFPFHWQCPYIPLCPLGLSDVLFAPCPFIVGIDSRFFDLYDPPNDVICVDLDTNRIWMPEDKKNLSYKQLPKRPARVLQETLHRLFDNLVHHPDQAHTTDEVSLEMAPIDHDFKRKKKEMQMELLIQEAFVRFMASLLKGYKHFLNPILKQPTLRATDASVLFDMQNFLKSRDKAYAKFFNQMMKTQMFFRFIEERSFVSDKDAGLAFFDECAEKVDELKEEQRLIEIDNSHASERTVFITPPEPIGLPEGVKYSYNGFPDLKPELFLKKKLSTLSLPGKQPVCPSSPLARRTKQEIRSAQKIAQQHIGNPQRWAKCLLSHCYSLWFIHLPAFVHSYNNKLEAFKIAYAVLQKMHEAKLYSPDEVCYRVLMQLCGQYNKPGLAIKVFLLMRKYGVQPNAITYGYYNKVMLEAKWPSANAKGQLLWTKIRNVIIGVAQFRRTIRRRSLSICSNSGSEFDQISRTSVDSYLDDAQHDKGDHVKLEMGGDVGQSQTDGLITKASIEERLSTGGVSDRGYSSMTQEDVKRLSQFMNSTQNHDASMPPPQHEPPKAKTESRNLLRLNLHKKVVRTHSSRNSKDEGSNGDQPVEQTYRRRLGSIVRKSLLRSLGSGSSFDTMKGNMIGSSAGLLMVSQSALENTAFLRNKENHEKQRKRHKSAGDFRGKTRSNSLFASWRPRSTSGDEDLSMRFSELVLKDKVSDILTEDTSAEDSVFKSSHCSSMVCEEISEDVKDSGVDLDENLHVSSDADESPETKDSDSCDTNSIGAVCNYSIPLTINVEDVNGCNTESSKPSTPPVLSTPVTENDPLGLFNEPKGGEVIVLAAQGNKPLISFSPSHSSETPNATIFSSTPFATYNKDQTDGKSYCSECNSEKPNGPVADGTGDHANHSARSAPVKKLVDLGRTSSSPDCLAETEKSKISIPPVKSQNVVESPQKNSTLSLTESVKQDGPSDFVLRRTQSLRKTNEALSGVLKFAATSARAAYSKFNELKQSITPSKIGSSTSLAKSIDEKDSGTGDEDSSSTVQEKQKFGGSQDLLSRSESSSDSAGPRASQMSFGIAPSPSYMDKFNPMKDFDNLKSSPLGKLCAAVSNIAVEVEVSSCSRCTRCHCLTYDEEIMAGWFADDSNLNTSCSFCRTSFVPHLQICVKDWRGGKIHALDDSLKGQVPFSENSCEPSSSEVEINTSLSMSNGDIPQIIGECMELNGPVETPSVLTSPPKSLSVYGCSEGTSLNRVLPDDPPKPPSPSSPDSYFLDLALTARRRTTSECLTRATDNMSCSSSIDSVDGFTGRSLQSPLSISIEEDEELPTSPSAVPEMKKDFMARSTSSIAPIVVPYLSPLVLRKELEYILEHEGDPCLMSDRFVDEHPIIFWNMVWYFRRIDVPSHLPGFLLTANSITKDSEVVRYEETYSSKHVLIRPLWDNIRIHDELGLPMYIAWNAGSSRSSVVDALITESQPFSRTVMFQIISNIQCNDVLSPIKLVMNNRRRLRQRKQHFRSLYREILFLSFIACGRENIDHDAFDREFNLAFDKLNNGEIRSLQKNDRPRSEGVMWCRRVFGELEV